MSDFLMKDPNTGLVTLVEAKRTFFNGKKERLIYTSEAISFLQNKCFRCPGYYQYNPPSCYMSPGCPGRIHGTGRVLVELRKNATMFYMDENGIIQDRLSPTSLTNLSFQSEFLTYFLYGIYHLDFNTLRIIEKMLGIKLPDTYKIHLHHGNQCPIDNRKENISAQVDINHLSNQIFHQKHHPGSKLDECMLIIYSQELELLNKIKKLISKDINEKSITEVKNEKIIFLDKVVKSIFFNIIFETKNNHPFLTEILKINNIEDEIKSFKRTKSTINYLRKIFTNLMKSPEFKEPIRIPNDPLAMDILYATQELIKPHAEQIIKGNIKPSTRNK